MTDTELPRGDEIVGASVERAAFARPVGVAGGRALRVAAPRLGEHEQAPEGAGGQYNEARSHQGRWCYTSALIDTAFGATGNILTFGDEPSKGNIDIFFTRWYCRGEDRSAWQREYFRDYYAEDEHLPRMRTLPDGKIVRVAELFSEQELKTSRMYNEALVRFEGQKGLIVRLDGPLGTRIVSGIADPVDASGWSSSRIDMIGRVLPHLLFGVQF